jgi:hypothetical protein
MERIDPNSVAAFFAAHPDIRPLRRGRFVAYRGREIVACCGAAAAAMAVDEGLGRRMDASSMVGACRLIERTLGLQVEYTNGFVDGWDEISRPTTSSTPEYDVGYEDGLMAHGTTSRIGSAVR